MSAAGRIADIADTTLAEFVSAATSLAMRNVTISAARGW